MGPNRRLEVKVWRDFPCMCQRAQGKLARERASTFKASKNKYVWRGTSRWTYITLWVWLKCSLSVCRCSQVAPCVQTAVPFRRCATVTNMPVRFTTGRRVRGDFALKTRLCQPSTPQPWVAEVTVREPAPRECRHAKSSVSVSMWARCHPKSKFSFALLLSDSMLLTFTGLTRYLSETTWLLAQSETGLWRWISDCASNRRCRSGVGSAVTHRLT